MKKYELTQYEFVKVRVDHKPVQVPWISILNASSCCKMISVNNDKFAFSI